MVFQPNWGKAHFFPDDEVDVLLSTSDLDPIEYRGELVKMQVYSTKLVFRPRAPTNDESLLVAGVTALKALKKLPETPVSGIGVNFAFIEEAAGAGLAKDIFDFPDDNPLQERGWEIEERTTSRAMMLQEQRLNFSTSCSEKKTRFHFNFETLIPEEWRMTPAQVLKAAQQQLGEDQVLQLRDLAIKLVHDVYGFVFEEGNSDDE